MAISQLTDLAHITLPVDVASVAGVNSLRGCYSPFEETRINSHSYYHTASVIASVIETITGSQRLRPDSSYSSDQLIGNNEWISTATRNGLLPICHIEASFGCPHSDSDVDATFSGKTRYLQSVNSPLANLSPFANEVRRGAKILTHFEDMDGNLECFLEVSATDRVRNRAFSNLLFSRGFTSPGHSLCIFLFR